ncbi:MAG: TonB-dependent receptor [Bacteroidales bacterium]|nr:TonB-dependent receptor [Bacteroidales bacterium]
MKQAIRFIWLFLFSTVVMAAVGQTTGTLTGTVTDEQTGETLPGANVVIQGTTIGTATDINGTYTIPGVPAGEHVVMASFIGFQDVTKKVTIVAGETLTVGFVLSEDMMMLDEMVVIGYGTKRKRDITSSISKVPVEEIRNIPTTSFESTLQGKAAGVQVTQDNGLAGGSVTIRVRGTGSVMSSSEPLYVLDGVPIITGRYTTTSGYPDRSNALSLINPEDIESIEILKDAAAQAIYGARGANGVVLITTKKGKEGETKYDFNFSSGFSQVTNKLDILNGSEYLMLAKEAWNNSGEGTERGFYEQLPYGIYNTNLLYEGNYSDFTEEQIEETYQANKKIIDNTHTDWVDHMLRTGYQHNASLSASGGNQRLTYYVGGSYSNTSGVIIGNDFERISGRTNLEIKATKKLKFGMNLGVTGSQFVNVPTGWAGGLGTAQSRSLPVMPVYNADGSYFAPRSGVNVVADYEDRKYKAYSTSMLTNIYADYQFHPGFNYRLDFGLNNLYQRERKYEGTITREEANATDRRLTVNNWNVSNTLGYNKTFNDIHRVTAMTGMSYERNGQYGVEFNGRDFPNPSLENPTNSNQDKQFPSAWQEDYAFLSFFGRAEYAFRERYIVSASVRHDGSSRFGPDQKWGTFPSATVGWILTEEPFMDNISVLSFFKLRGSWGITGNSEIGNYRYVGLYYTTQYNGESGIGLQQIPNPELHWEVSNQYDIGIDFGLWEGRVAGGMDYYLTQSEDLLLLKQIPLTTGARSYTANLGEIKNQGFELFLNSKNLVRKFKWNTDINLATNRNEIINLEGQIISGLDVGGNYGNNFAQEGHPIGAWRLVEWYGVDPGTGVDLFVLNDGSIAPWDDTDPEFFDKHSKVTGNPYPDFFGGVNNYLEYAGFDLGIYFTFVVGNEVYRDDGKFFEGGNLGSNWNQMATILDRWQNPGDVTDQSKLLWNSNVSTINSTKYLDDGSYLRLKSLTFGYTLPPEKTRKLKMERVRIYFTASNLWTITNYKGWDPEVNRDYNYASNVTQSVTYLSPPQAKTFNVGLSLNF